MGAMWSEEEVVDEKPKSKRSRGSAAKTNKSSFFDDFSFSEIDEEEEDEPEELEEPIYVAPVAFKKRGSKCKSKSVRFARGLRKGTKKNGY